VPELWRFENERLQISILDGAEYVSVEQSQIFPKFPFVNIIPKYLAMANTEGRTKAIRAFRQWVRDQLEG
jgi:hypothetical protein